MTAALANNVIDLPMSKANVNVIDLPMSKDLDRAALKNVVGGYGPDGTTYKNYHYKTRSLVRRGWRIYLKTRTHHKHVKTTIFHTDRYTRIL